MSDAIALFTATARTCWNKFADIFNFRRVAAAGLPLSTTLVHGESGKFAREFFSDPEYDELFLDKEGALKALDAVGGVEGMARKMAESQLDSFRRAIDSASLIFAHSILDGVALDFCRATALVSPQSWEAFVEQKQIKLQDLRSANYEQVRWSKIEEALDVLERQSLLTKVDRLFAICKPPANFSPIREYRFDREHLEQLDPSRHDAVHTEALGNPLPKGDADIWFLMSTGNFLMAMVHDRFDLRIDPMTFVTGAKPTQ